MYKAQSVDNSMEKTSTVLVVAIAMIVITSATHVAFGFRGPASMGLHGRGKMCLAQGKGSVIGGVYVLAQRRFHCALQVSVVTSMGTVAKKCSVPMPAILDQSWQT